MEIRAVLLDDDDLILRSWALSAKKAGVSLTTFRDSGLFREALKTLPKDTSLYIDAQLAKGEKGDVVAREAYDLGFTAIYIATGLPPDSFPLLTWVKGIIGKDPPW